MPDIHDISPTAVAALEAELFRGPWVLIAADNTSPARARNLSAARADLAAGTARSIAGRVRPGILVADIDPPPGYALVGDACAESLVKWCVDQGLPYLVRESGRPGGRHVLTAARTRRHRRQWRQLCARLSRQYAIDVDDRTGKTLRLLSSPHRQGLPCPILSCTLTPADITAIPHAARDWDRGVSGRTRFRGASSGQGARDGSRSAREYGKACALVRAGYRAADAWHIVAVAGSKALTRGRRWWQRYEWMPAVTTVAAEQGRTESEAWALARTACPPGYARIRREWWLVLWERAVVEATTSRPRRLHVGDVHVDLARDSAREIDVLRTELATAGNAVLPTLPIRPQRRASVTRVLFHLAEVLVKRNGSISVRDLAERTLMDAKTVRAALAVCVRAGLLVVVHRYSGGAKDTAAYGVGPEVTAGHGDHQTSPTSCSTPGRASLPRLRAQHAADRHRWALRCDALAQLLPGERLATSNGRSAKLLRSLHHQRRWVRALDAAQLETRRALRRRLLHGIDATVRSAWLNWLGFRKRLVQSVDRLQSDNCRDEDLYVIGLADDTVHRGLRGARWQPKGDSYAA
ncbi:hypothetical protein [Nocardia sp. NPDC057668]|uniref:hypothetical protein n=1 Tax=Nocardia sp. NPDC057668 TaxID=3346202 RepID=UPI00366FE3C6